MSFVPIVYYRVYYSLIDCKTAKQGHKKGLIEIIRSASAGDTLIRWKGKMLFAYGLLKRHSSGFLRSTKLFFVEFRLHCMCRHEGNHLHNIYMQITVWDTSRVRWLYFSIKEWVAFCYKWRIYTSQVSDVFFFNSVTIHHWLLLYWQMNTLL